MTQIRGNQSILDKNTDAKTDSVNDMKIENFPPVRLGYS